MTHAQKGIEVSANLTHKLKDDGDSATLFVETADGRKITIGVLVSGLDRSIIVQADTEEDAGNVRIFVNDGGDPLFDEDPETGDYRDMDN